MSLGPKPGEDVFTEDDLAPSDEDLRALRRHRLDKAATIVAAIALGLFLGGTIALGACAAPMVFELVPAPLNGKAMGAAFRRFDFIAIGCGVVVLGCEAFRTFLASGLFGGGRRQATKERILRRARLYGAILLAGGIVWTGMVLSPRIMALHEAGARRNVGPEGAELESTHKTAELLGKIDTVLALLLIALHIGSLRSPRYADDDELADAPLAPGPRR
ncbi:MAG: DUF4149 domain-containing protein [Polyangiaceae bacterium]